MKGIGPYGAERKALQNSRRDVGIAPYEGNGSACGRMLSIGLFGNAYMRRVILQ